MKGDLTDAGSQWAAALRWLAALAVAGAWLLGNHRGWPAAAAMVGDRVAELPVWQVAVLAAGLVWLASAIVERGGRRGASSSGAPGHGRDGAGHGLGGGGAWRRGAAENGVVSPSASSCFKLYSGDVPTLRVSDELLGRFVNEIARVHAVAINDMDYVGDPEICRKIRRSLDSLRQTMARKLPVEGLHEPLDDPYLARTLVATDFNVQNSAAIIEKYLAYRREVGGGVVPPREILRKCIFALPFVDVLGRPVLYIWARNIDTRMPLPLYEAGFRATMDAIICFFLHKRTTAQGNFGERQNALEQYVVVIDTEGAGWNNVSLDFLRMMVRETTVNYPDRLQEVVVLGASQKIKAIWRVAEPLVHPRTRKKVRLISKADVNAAMQRMVPHESLPSTWGGAAPPLALPQSQEVTSLEDRAGRLAAETWRRLGLQLEECEARVSRVPGRWLSFEPSAFRIWLDHGGQGAGVAAAGAGDDELNGHSTRGKLRTEAECVEFVSRLQARVPKKRTSLEDLGTGRDRGCCLWRPVKEDDPTVLAQSSQAMERWLNVMLGAGPEARRAVHAFAGSRES